MPTTLTPRRLITETGEIDYPVITMDEGAIVAIEPGSPHDAAETLTAAFFDIHVHGALSHDFMAAIPTEIDAVGRFLASRGLGWYLPTTVTGQLDATFRALASLADAIERYQQPGAPRDAAAPVGIHLEGPFVSHAKRGVHPAGAILEPSIAVFDRFQQAARGHIRLMTIAPELPNAIELIAHATALGVRISLGHSDATEAETLPAIAAGATSGTHLFNAMRPLNQREPGIAGVLLDDPNLYAEMICDGIHVHPAMVRLWLRMKGEARGILITDGMSATGMPDGEYTLGDFAVQVSHGVCLAGGALAGSVLTMDAAVANVQRFTGTSLGGAVRMASRNPAQMLGLPHTGLNPGSPAHFNVYDDYGRRTGTILHGKYVKE